MTAETEDWWRERIVRNPAVLAGKPTIRGMRIGVDLVIEALAAGVRETELLHDYPDLEPDDIRACLWFAAEAVTAMTPDTARAA